MGKRLVLFGENEPKDNNVPDAEDLSAPLSDLLSDDSSEDGSAVLSDAEIGDESDVTEDIGQNVAPVRIPAGAPGSSAVKNGGGGKGRGSKKATAKTRRFSEWLSSSLFLIPSLLGVVIFFFYPYLMLVRQSFVRSHNNSDFVGLSNYINVLNNQGFKDASMNTLIFSVYAVPLAVILSLLLALLLNSKIPGGSWFRSSFLQPLIVPVASIVLIWQVFFSFNGTINTFLTSIGEDKIDWLKSDWGRIVILLLFLWKNLGYNMVLFLSALNNIPTEFMESAKIDGGGPVKRFFYISIPYLYPTIFFVGIMSLINSFKVFREIYLLTGDIPVNALYMLQHFMNNAFKNLDYQKLSAGAVVMSIVMIVIVGVLFLAENKLGSDVEE